MIDPLIHTLLTKPSISPKDAGCQDILAAYLRRLGFELTAYNQGDVTNLYAKKTGKKPGPSLMFAGHTDVVPTGPQADWYADPFVPTEKEGYLYARGAADMKVALACMVLACDAFIQQHPDHCGDIAFLITSCEEKTTLDGTDYVMKQLIARGESIDYCIVGEPSSEQTIADQIRIGRRGSLSGCLTVQGKQGHVAYPHHAVNPIHQALSALQSLTNHVWDEGYGPFAPTTFQFSSIHAGTGATNVIPGTLIAEFNLRYSPALTATEIQTTIIELLSTDHLDMSVSWSQGGEPFLSQAGALREAVDDSVLALMGHRPKHSTDGGTSDARFIAPHGIETIELGFCHQTIHQVNECIPIQDISILQTIYQRILGQLLNDQ